MPKRVEHGNTGAKQRPGFFRRKVVGDGSNCLRRRDQVLCITTIMAETRNFSGLAKNEIPASTSFAMEAMAAMPANSNALADIPIRGVGSDGIDPPGNLMSGDSRIGKSRP
jgi:hypothetical protein